MRMHYVRIFFVASNNKFRFIFFRIQPLYYKQYLMIKYPINC